jgi:hypothetical protein
MRDTMIRLFGAASFLAAACLAGCQEAPVLLTQKQNVETELLQTFEMADKLYKLDDAKVFFWTADPESPIAQGTVAEVLMIASELDKLDVKAAPLKERMEVVLGTLEKDEARLEELDELKTELEEKIASDYEAPIAAHLLEIEEIQRKLDDPATPPGEIQGLQESLARLKEELAQLQEGLAKAQGELDAYAAEEKALLQADEALGAELQDLTVQTRKIEDEAHARVNELKTKVEFQERFDPLRVRFKGGEITELELEGWNPHMELPSAIRFSTKAGDPAVKPIRGVSYQKEGGVLRFEAEMSRTRKFVFRLSRTNYVNLPASFVTWSGKVIERAYNGNEWVDVRIGVAKFIGK